MAWQHSFVKRAVTVAMLVALVVAPAASAKLGLRFDRPTAKVGQPIGLVGAGYLADDRRGPWRVYLVRAPLLALAIFPPYGGGQRMTPPRDVPIHPLGRISRLPGRHVVTVPRVPPGRYGLIAWCSGCRDAPLLASYYQGVPDGAVLPWRGELLTVRR